MISIVIPALNAEHDLPATLSALVPATIMGLVREVIVVDGGSADGTRRIADAVGAELVSAPPGRGTQLAAGARRARSEWILFLHADTVLEESWVRETQKFMHAVDSGARPLAAAVFRFKLDDWGMGPRALEALVHLRCRVLRLPYGDQGLLIPRRLYDEIGGFKDVPIMEDVDIIRRLGRRRIALFDTRAVTSPARYQHDGYLARAVRNQVCLALYGVGLPLSTIARFYASKPVRTVKP